MTQLLFIEIFVLGASFIAAIYHAVLFIQQKDKFLLFYSIYLITLSAYLLFKLISNNYNPFLPTTNNAYYITEEVLQIIMVCNYTTFAAVTLEVTKKPRLVRNAWISFLVIGGIFIIIHIFKAILFGPGVTSYQTYASSRLSMITIATIGLALAWRARTTVFQRTIIIGSFVYDISGLLSALSFISNNSKILGLNGVEPYLIGCLIDIIIFSSAFGYRIKLIAQQKNKLLQNELAINITQNNIGKTLNDMVGASLSSIHVYASLAQKLVVEQPEKAQEYLQEINNNALQTMDEVGDIVWALNLTPETIRDALSTRIKRYGLEILAPQNIQCDYLIDQTALETIQDISTAKKVLQQVKDAMQSIAEKKAVSNVSVSIELIKNLLCVSVA